MNHKLELSPPTLYDRESVEFFPDNEKRVSIEEVFDFDVAIPHQPFEYNVNSPTPGDPYALRIGTMAGAIEPRPHHGYEYKAAAELFMEAALEENAYEIGLNEKYIEPVMAEIITQHYHRIETNNAAFQRFKEPFGSVGSIDKDTAELIMRVRAGIGAVDEPARLIAADPAIGGFEAMKATRPFMKDQMQYADLAFQRDLRLASMQPDSPIRNLNIFNDSPYRISVLNENNIIVTKRIQASMDIGRRSLQVISRESYIGLHENEKLRISKPDYRKIGHSVVNLLPIGIAKYYRIAK